MKQTKPVAEPPSVPPQYLSGTVLHMKNIKFVLKPGIFPSSETHLPRQAAAPRRHSGHFQPRVTQLTLLHTLPQPGARTSHPKSPKKKSTAQTHSSPWKQPSTRPRQRGDHSFLPCLGGTQPARSAAGARLLLSAPDRCPLPAPPVL